MSRARSTIFTGSPMSSTKISPPLPMQTGLQHELRRLGDRHEVARDLRVGHRDRAAARDLLAEASGSRCRCCRARCRSAPMTKRVPSGALQRLARRISASALGRAHHVGRVDRLVGRDQHESLDARALGRLGPRRRCRGRCSAPPPRRCPPPSAARACRPRRGTRPAGGARPGPRPRAPAFFTSPIARTHGSCGMPLVETPARSR